MGALSSTILNICVWFYLVYQKRKSMAIRSNNIALSIVKPHRNTQIGNISGRRRKNRNFSNNRLLVYSNCMDLLKCSFLSSFFMGIRVESTKYEVSTIILFFTNYFFQFMNFFFLLVFHRNFRLQVFTYASQVKILKIILFFYFSYVSLSVSRFFNCL